MIHAFSIIVTIVLMYSTFVLMNFLVIAKEFGGIKYRRIIKHMFNPVAILFKDRITRDVDMDRLDLLENSFLIKRQVMTEKAKYKPKMSKCLSCGQKPRITNLDADSIWGYKRRFLYLVCGCGGSQTIKQRSMFSDKESLWMHAHPDVIDRCNILLIRRWNENPDMKGRRISDTLDKIIAEVDSM